MAVSSAIEGSTESIVHCQPRVSGCSAVELPTPRSRPVGDKIVMGRGRIWIGQPAPPTQNVRSKDPHGGCDCAQPVCHNACRSLTGSAQIAQTLTTGLGRRARPGLQSALRQTPCLSKGPLQQGRATSAGHGAVLRPARDRTGEGARRCALPGVPNYLPMQCKRTATHISGGGRPRTRLSFTVGLRGCRLRQASSGGGRTSPYVGTIIGQRYGIPTTAHPIAK